MITGKYQPALKRVLQRVIVDGSECWPMARVSNNGYGIVYDRGRRRFGQHVTYEALVGPIPDGMQLDHLCRNRACVRPDHLEAVTPQENTLRGIGPSAQHARQTHCVHGHEFTPDNTKRRANGARSCRTCENEASRRRYARRHEPKEK